MQLRIARTMRVNDILTLLPHAGPLMAEYGLHCFNCSFNTMENLEQGCRSHAMPEAEIDDLVMDLNEMLATRPKRQQTLAITEAAAKALREMLEAEGKRGWGLSVGLDENGRFSMEFAERAAAADFTFSNSAVPDLNLFASAATLEGIGGATIDLRDGRFKIDLPAFAEAMAGGPEAVQKVCKCGKGDACGCGGGACGCHT